MRGRREVGTAQVGWVVVPPRCGERSPGPLGLGASPVAKELVGVVIIDRPAIVLPVVLAPLLLLPVRRLVGDLVCAGEVVPAELVLLLDDLARAAVASALGSVGSESAEGCVTAGVEGTHSVREAARRLRLTERRVRQLIADGRLPAVRTSKGWKIDAECVGGLAERRRGRAPAAA